MAKARELVEVQSDVEKDLLREELKEAHNAVLSLSTRMEESLSNLSLMLENTGWTELSTYTNEGPTLEEVHRLSEKLKNLTGLNAHIGRGARLRHAYIWEGGLHHANIPKGGRQGAVNVQAVIDDPINQRNFFGNAARERQEKACYATGHYFIIGEEARPARRGGRGGPARAATPKRLKPMPLIEVSAALVDPDDSTDIWAIRRSWAGEGVVSLAGLNTLDTGNKHEWIYLNRHLDKRGAVVDYNGTDEQVAQDKVLFMEQVNRLDGWMWGLPDATAAFAWADQYRRGVLNGLKMQEALATLAFKIKAQTSRSASAAAAKVADATTKGSTMGMTDSMDVAALSTAGSGYDFDSLRPVLSIVATSIDVSVVALSSDPGAAGSSYGSAATLDSPTRLSMTARRAIHLEFEREILAWLGAKDAEVWFDPMQDGGELYRELQALLMPYLQGLYSPQEQRDVIDAFMGWPAGKVPAGVLTPNNSKSLPRKDIDTDTAGAATVPNPNQGQNTGTGNDNNSGNDVRTDTVT